MNINENFHVSAATANSLNGCECELDLSEADWRQSGNLNWRDGDEKNTHETLLDFFQLLRNFVNFSVLVNCFRFKAKTVFWHVKQSLITTRCSNMLSPRRRKMKRNVGLRDFKLSREKFPATIEEREKKAKINSSSCGWRDDNKRQALRQALCTPPSIFYSIFGSKKLNS